MSQKHDSRWNPKADLFPADLSRQERARDLEQGAAAEIIRNKVGAIARQRRLQPADCEDLIQSLSLHLWDRADQFDPSRGSWPTFANVVVDRRLKSLLQQKRDLLLRAQRGVDELDVEQDRRRPSTGISDRERAELRWDVDSIVSRLPGDQKDLCRRVQQLGPTEAARDVGMPARRWSTGSAASRNRSNP